MIESFLAGREVLYVFKQDGCPACEAAAPELAKFTAKHPTVTVLTLDANGPFAERLGVKVKATPTYVFRHGNDAVTRAGAMKLGELEKWIRGAGGAL